MDTSLGDQVLILVIVKVRGDLRGTAWGWDPLGRRLNVGLTVEDDLRDVTG